MRKLKNNELQRIDIPEFKKVKKTPLIVVLDNVRSALNVGAIFRSCDAFLIKKIILCGVTACPPNKEIRKSALGSSDSVEWEYIKETTNAINILKEKGYSIVAIEQTNKSILLDKFIPQEEPIAIVLGNEVTGVSEKVIRQCDISVEIPQYGTKHSLNISVAAGIVIWKFSSKLNK